MMTDSKRTTLDRLLHAVDTRDAVISVIGLGYVGLPLAKGLAHRGFTVYGVEENEEKVRFIQDGRDYIDPHLKDLPELLDRLTATTDFSVVGRAQVVIVCVPTPLTKNLEPDISYVEKVSRAIGRHIQPGTLVILESTTYPGTTDEVVKPAVESGGRVKQVGKDYFLAFSPERVDPGNPHYNTYNTTKVLGGATESCAKAARAVYEALLEDPELVRTASCTRAAEMEKLFENIFRSVNIALVNELAILCRSMGLDVWEIIDLASSKPYGFMPFYPGPGIGGHCIPLDPFYLSWKAREYDFRTRFIELAGELNSKMPRHVVELASEVLADKGLSGSRVLLVGAAYKPNISDSRESPAIRIAELLNKRGAELSLYDPLACELKLRDGQTLESLPQVGEEQFDLTILLTVHDGMNLEELCRCSGKVVDTRGVTRGLDLPGEILVLGTG
jgi:UDP-N-acetyl-D-glucosamine dehydrogenase